MEDWELKHYAVQELGQIVSSAGMRWLHLTIVYGKAPDANWMAAWEFWHCHALTDQLRREERVLVHCLGGRGQTGLVVALLMMEAGMSTQQAISLIRAARDGAIEIVEQEQFVESYSASS